MFRTITSLSVKVDEWESLWVLANETPVTVCKEMLIQMLKEVSLVEDQIKAQQEAEKEKKESEDEKIDEVKEVQNGSEAP